jgi:hypothetical protein
MIVIGDSQLSVNSPKVKYFLGEYFTLIDTSYGG